MPGRAMQIFLGLATAACVLVQVEADPGVASAAFLARLERLIPVGRSAVPQAPASRVEVANDANVPCLPRADASERELSELRETNCRRVKVASDTLSKLADTYHNEFAQRIEEARNLCEQAEDMGDSQAATRTALQAWSNVMTQGGECCNEPGPPFCVSSELSKVGHRGGFFGLMLSIFVAFAVCGCLFTPRELYPGHGDETTNWQTALHRLRHVRGQEEEEAAAPVPPGGAAAGEAAGPEGEAVLREMLEDPLRQRLEAAWSGDNLLKEDIFNGAAWGEICVNMFVALHVTFGFQDDSVINQFEHFISLLRSHCSMVDDRSRPRPKARAARGAAAGRAPRAAGVEADRPWCSIAAGLNSLHTELLDGYTKYLKQAWPPAAPGGGDADHDVEADGRDADHEVEAAVLEPIFAVGEWNVPAAGHTNVPRTGPATHHELAGQPNLELKQLGKVAVYLLVWGEAGNLRFMPEVLYFLTHLVLMAKGPSASVWRDGRRVRNIFLVRAVRPIYDVVFEACYTEVKIRDGSPPTDVKSLHDDCKNFMTPDTPNYDDWNELFCHPSRMKKALVLRTGQRFFDGVPEVGSMLRFLPDVDWRKSLRDVKTHREVHSMSGLFVGIHRVVFLHVAAFCCTYVAVANALDSRLYDIGKITIGGNSPPVRAAAVGLLVPLHAIFWYHSRWVVSGPGLWPAEDELECDSRGREYSKNVFLFIFWLCPIASYTMVRYAEAYPNFGNLGFLGMFELSRALLFVHFTVCLAGALVILLSPAAFWSRGSTTGFGWTLTSVGGWSAARWAFWILVFGVKVMVGIRSIRSLDEAMDALLISRPGREALGDVWRFAFSPNWDKDMFEWLILTTTGLVLYVADTQFWFSFGCTICGVCVAFYQRGDSIGWACGKDLVADIPRAFSQATRGGGEREATGASDRRFTTWWNKVVDNMYKEYKITTIERSKLRYNQDDEHIALPYIFSKHRFWDRCLPCMQDVRWPRNAEVQYRIMALARALTLPMARPFEVPYIPGLTVLIPHFEEAILQLKEDLFPTRRSEAPETHTKVPLMSLIEYRYSDEFENLANMLRDRMAHGNHWKGYNRADWDEVLAPWASMRSQTLQRTVEGMMLYHEALEEHRTASTGRTGQPFRTEEVFRCLVSMQKYAFFTEVQLRQVNAMLDNLPPTLKIAYIGYEDVGWGPQTQAVALDAIHRSQCRRYYSCLIDKTSEVFGDLKRQPKFQVELPGFPILGDGKADNQNHAIIFSRGTVIQVIDANQGAYFEQALLLPCVLGEFRQELGDDDKYYSKKIVGFPEHITSDFGSIGDFAAGAEMAFGTILQRSYAVLGGRMHYGHPDMMSKVYMMQQGGVSKGTKTVNVSEDIFAGMDFTLRGDGRHIKHVEYFMLAKGRDLGFGTVQVFFSKLAAGTSEQLLTRQVARLAEQMNLPEYLTFYYGHGGFYITQWLISKGVPLLVYVWLLVVVDDAEASFGTTDSVTKSSTGRVVMVRLLLAQFSWLMIFFLIASTGPLVLELWMQAGLLPALIRLFKQFLTMAPLHFIFQAKVIGEYVSKGFVYGGAEYKGTGRGLPTERRPFIGPGKNPGLFNDYAELALYDGTRLLAYTVFVWLAGGLWDVPMREMAWWLVPLGMTIASWMFAPFIFNPYQFSASYFWDDLDDLRRFFLHGKPPPAALHQAADHAPAARVEMHLVGPAPGAAGCQAADHAPAAGVEMHPLGQAPGAGGREAAHHAPAAGAQMHPMGRSLWAELEAGLQVCRDFFAGRLPEPEWVKWYAESQLKAKRGDIRFNPMSLLVWAVFLASWYTVIMNKMHVVTVVYDNKSSSFWRDLAAVYPPCLLSAMVCSAVAARTFYELTSVKVPPCVLALLCAVLDALEIYGGLRPFCLVGSRNSIIAGIVLKYAWLSVLAVLAECLLRVWPAHPAPEEVAPTQWQRALHGTQWYMENHGVLDFIKLWLEAHRMTRDMATAALIFSILSLGTGLDKLRTGLCGCTCSLHNLLVYRSLGHPTRNEEDLRAFQQVTRRPMWHRRPLTDDVQETPLHDQPNDSEDRDNRVWEEAAGARRRFVYLVAGERVQVVEDRPASSYCRVQTTRGAASFRGYVHREYLHDAPPPLRDPFQVVRRRMRDTTNLRYLPILERNGPWLEVGARVLTLHGGAIVQVIEPMPADVFSCVQVEGHPERRGWVRFAYLGVLPADEGGDGPPGSLAPPPAAADAAAAAEPGTLQVGPGRRLRRYQRTDNDPEGPTNLRYWPTQETDENEVQRGGQPVLLQRGDMVEVLDPLPAGEFSFVQLERDPRRRGWVLTANLDEVLPESGAADADEAPPLRRGFTQAATGSFQSLPPDAGSQAAAEALDLAPPQAASAADPQAAAESLESAPPQAAPAADPQAAAEALESAPPQAAPPANPQAAPRMRHRRSDNSGTGTLLRIDPHDDEGENLLRVREGAKDMHVELQHDQPVEVVEEKGRYSLVKTLDQRKHQGWIKTTHLQPAVGIAAGNQIEAKLLEAE